MKGRGDSGFSHRAHAYPIGRHPWRGGYIVTRRPAHLKSLVPRLEIEQQAGVLAYRFEEPRLDLANSGPAVFGQG